MSDEQKPRCEKCNRRIKERWIFSHSKAPDYEYVYVGPTCRKKYIESGQYSEEDFMDTKPRKKRGS